MTDLPPEPGPFLTAAWRYLAMLNYAVDPALLAGRVPPGTELDPFEGGHFVSVVGFLFEDTRVLGVPVPGHRHFEEINLRFYVRRREADGWRRGVAFVKEIVPRPAIATVARCFYEEPYVAHPCRHEITWHAGDPRTPDRVGYEWRREGRWESVTVAAEPGAPAPLVVGSHEQYIAEHYWGYTRHQRRFGGRRGRTSAYRVEHPPWRVWPVREARLEADVASLYGAEFAGPLAGPPTSAFLAEGSPVTVYRGRLLR